MTSLAKPTPALTRPLVPASQRQPAPASGSQWQPGCSVFGPGLNPISRPRLLARARGPAPCPPPTGRRRGRAGRARRGRRRPAHTENSVERPETKERLASRPRATRAAALTSLPVNTQHPNIPAAGPGRHARICLVSRPPPPPPAPSVTSPLIPSLARPPLPLPPSSSPRSSYLFLSLLPRRDNPPPPGKTPR